MNETPVRTGFGFKHTIIAILVVVFCAAFAFIYGFVVFTRTQPLLRSLPAEPVDGVVVLTGGANRISVAMKLLSQGHAKRLLISGVYPNTSLAELARKYPGYRNYFKCCVDLDYKAQNTIGNAMETFHWTRTHKLNSLIVVTSAFHMRRSLLELRHVLPEIKIYPYPVIQAKAYQRERWVNLFKDRLLFSEYIKYILARIRIALFAPHPRPLSEKTG